MIRTVFFVFCLLGSPFLAAQDDSGSESVSEPVTTAALLETFAEPLYLELIGSGLAPLLAKAESSRLLTGLTECYDSDLNETDSAEPPSKTVHMGGQTIMTYATPCLDAFLAAVDEAKL